MDPNATLMAKIKAELGDYIAGAVADTPFSPALVAAITANESGGNASESRFEPAVAAELGRVISGQVAEYSPRGIRGPIGAQDLLAVCYPNARASSGAAQVSRLGALGDEAAIAAGTTSFTPAQSHQALINLATSWGPTQIMGWHSIELDIALSEIVQLQSHYDVVVEMLTWFYTHYLLADREDLGSNGIPGALLNCWNTGDPKAQTFDPDYVANGLARMALYV
jgi:hypothetical protein